MGFFIPITDKVHILNKNPYFLIMIKKNIKNHIFNENKNEVKNSNNWVLGNVCNNCVSTTGIVNYNNTTTTIESRHDTRYLLTCGNVKYIIKTNWTPSYYYENGVRKWRDLDFEILDVVENSEEDSSFLINWYNQEQNVARYLRLEKLNPVGDFISCLNFHNCFIREIYAFPGNLEIKISFSNFNLGF